MAEAVSKQGGTFYKDGRYTKAQECYEVAMRLSPKEPKYASNLSAVLYEAGQYSKAIAAIRLSWQLLRARNEADGQSSTPTIADPLAVKLATRFAKACSHRFCSKDESQAHGKSKDTDEEIESLLLLCPADVDDVKIKDLQAAWMQWRTLLDGKAEHEADKEAARKRMRSVRIFKSPEEPTLEYFTFGHDEVLSLMNGINNSDDYCLDGDKDYADQRVWSFLFGGSGDARHVFGTLVHLNDMADELGTLRPTNAFKVHLTLIDIHPASLARVIVVMSLIRQILHTRLSKDKARAQELYATLFYVYTAYLMPDYCHQIIMDTAKALVNELPEKRNSLSKCLFINEQSLPAIIDVLEYWSTPLPKTTKQFIQNNIASDTYATYMARMASMMGFDPQQQKAKAASTKKGNADDGIYGDPEAEKTIYERTWALIPPRPLLLRHPALAKLVKKYVSASDELYTEAKREVEETWKVNPTLFDKKSTEHPMLCKGEGYPRASADVCESASHFEKFIQEFKRGPLPAFCRGSATYTTITHFFSFVADAMWVLQNVLTVEIVVSEVITGTAKLIAGDLGARPKKAPDAYTRIWLSNVPDYTNGLLNSAVHIAPYLERKGLVMWNCLLNTGSWKSVAEYCYNYTLLLPKDVPRFLGCKVVNPTDTLWWDVGIQRMDLPRPLEKLASKKELHDWLGHLLMSTMCSGYPSPPPSKVEMPNNLGAFMHVLTHLRRVGFPAHWIGDFMHSVVTDTLVTALEPYRGRLPVLMPEPTEPEEPRRVRLYEWHANLQVLVAETRDALPFALSLPKECPSLSDIATYSTAVTRVDLSLDPRARQWGPLTSPFSPAVGALFFKSKWGTWEGLPDMLFGLLEGAPAAVGMADPRVQVVLGLEQVDLALGKVSWKMGRAWHARMVREEWSMMLFRADLRAAVTKQVEAKLWAEVM